MAILTQQELVAESNATYFDNVSGSITPTLVRTFNDDFISSSITADLTGSFATTGSNTFTGTQTITGSVNIKGNISAESASFQYVTTIYETASIIYSSGSNQLGDASDDVQTLWGQVFLPSGPLVITGSIYTNGSITILNNGNNSSLTDTELNIEANQTPAASYIVSFNQTASSAVISYDGATYDNELWTIADGDGIRMTDWNNGTGNLSTTPFISVIANDGSQPAPQFNRGLGVTGSLYQSGTFYADQIDVSRGGINQTTGSYVMTYSSSGLITYDTYQNVAEALSPFISASNATSASYALTASYIDNAAYLTTGSLGQTQVISGSFLDTNTSITTPTLNLGGFLQLTDITDQSGSIINASIVLGGTGRGGGSIGFPGITINTDISGTINAAGGVFSGFLSKDPNYGPGVGTTGFAISSYNGNGEPEAVYYGFGTGSNNDDNTIFKTKFDSNNLFIYRTTELSGSLNVSGSINVLNDIIGNTTLTLKPDPNDARYLQIYNTSPTDTHITASGGYLFVGDDTTYVKVDNYSTDKVIEIRADNGLYLTGSVNVSGSLSVAGSSLSVGEGINFYPDASAPSFDIGNPDGTSPYPGMRFVVDTTQNPGNIYSYFSIDNLGEPTQSQNFGFASTNILYGPNLTSVIYGPGTDNNGTSINTFLMYYSGSDSTVAGSGKLDIGKDTRLIGSLNVSSSLNVAGDLLLASGSDKTTGIVTLNGSTPSTVTVSNSLVAATSMIFLTKQTNTSAGAVAISDKSGGSFTITSTLATDSDQVAYMIVNPGYPG